MVNLLEIEFDSTNEKNVFVAITVAVLAFIFYYFINRSITNWIEDKNKFSKTNQLFKHALSKFLGLILFGIFPASLVILILPMNFRELGIGTQNMTKSFLYSLPLGFFAIIINRFAASKPKNLAVYPQMRIPVWTPVLFIFNAICWSVYLLGYEFLFRGVLLFLCLPQMGVINSVTINTAFYSLAHVHKGFRETIGAIPLGIILCILTLQTGTIWCAFLIHVTLALSNDFWSVYHNKEMAIALNKSAVCEVNNE